MEPASEEMSRIFEVGGRREEVWREWIMKGGEMEDVAGKKRLVGWLFGLG